MNETSEKEKKVWYKNTISYLWIVAGIFFIASIAVPQYLYFSHFKGGFAEKADAWGQYGDFIGGITNPILSAISIGVLVVLTITVNRNEKKRHDDAIKLEEARNAETIALEEQRNKANIEAQRLIALNQFRFDAFNSLKIHLDNFREFPLSFMEMSHNYQALKDYLNGFDDYHNFLFDNSDYDETIITFAAICNDIYEKTSKLNNSIIPKKLYDDYVAKNDVLKSPLREEYGDLIEKYKEIKADLINIMQLIIVGRADEFEDVANFTNF